MKNNCRDWKMYIDHDNDRKEENLIGFEKRE